MVNSNADEIETGTASNELVLVRYGKRDIGALIKDPDIGIVVAGFQFQAEMPDEVAATLIAGGVPRYHAPKRGLSVALDCAKSNEISAIDRVLHRPRVTVGDNRTLAVSPQDEYKLVRYGLLLYW